MRAIFFGLVPDWSSDFFYGRISGDRSESWEFFLDEVPSLLLVSLTGAHLLIWCVESSARVCVSARVCEQ